MENLYTEYKIAQLISREFIDDLTPDEMQVLENWKNSSLDNKNLYEQIKQGEKRKRRNAYVESLDKKAAWIKIREEIKPDRKVIRLKEWSLRIAAVLIIGVLIAGLYHISTKDIEIGQELAEMKIEPGSSKAVLQLHNGRTIQLENVKSDSILEKDGTIISNQKGKLAYASGQANHEGMLYNQVKVPVGGEYQLTLADGTRVWLNSDSEIKYPVQFSEVQRKVWIAGEVYFDVAHNKQKPFIVDVKDIEIEVLGTEFNVEAYHDQNTITTSLIEGSVKLRKNNESVIIAPDQQAIISKDENHFFVRDVDASMYALWKDGVFYFKEASLGTIMEKLERWYNVKVFFMNQSVINKRFSVEVKRYEDINEILDIISKTGKVNFEIKSNIITVKN
ncbi:FecR family protein [Marinifilum fragile]|uniref:FecR family protein n=1 Tax=Marinifilum fragile TaxID=570161 RepID=UPI0006D20C5A|nr:FecR family protein [Marinifilum fragile]